jgi:hypothetical protein
VKKRHCISMAEIAYCLPQIVSNRPLSTRLRGWTAAKKRVRRVIADSLDKWMVLERNAHNGARDCIACRVEKPR